MKKLYPLKFKPILKDKIWGGDKLKLILNKNYAPLPNCGESWEISGVQDNISVVSNGFLADNNLEEIIEVYMGDLVGDKVYDLFGMKFPLLIKFIDANDQLSIQVHPDDELAFKRHKGFGKTEMWYIINADNNAELISGFNKDVNKKEYINHLNQNTLKEILNIEKVSSGNVFFIPSGRVHAICKGIVLAEIQQTSDVTYRIYDWDRIDTNGKKRDLHTELALDAIDFKYYSDYKTKYFKKLNESSTLINCKYFTTNILEFNQTIEKDYNNIDSFIILMCIEGEYLIKYDNKEKPVKAYKGETILLPACIKYFELKPLTQTKLLEIYISGIKK
ncbi:MAG: class I mannose-6-phosphate isomerase [Bacteroidales bacterium]|nr:class I mannose-6-phosphate isomerase [Bacteroidales bacterium]